MWSSVISKFLMDISRNLMSVEFNKILKLVELGRLFRCRVDISRNFRIIDLGRSSRFQFKV